VVGLVPVAAAAGAAASPLGERLPLWSLGPFASLLLAIAVLPIAAEQWWHHNRNRAVVAALLSIPFAVWLVVSFGVEGLGELEHAAVDYASFLALLGSLYVVSGGVRLSWSAAASPASNAALLAVGAVLANLIGTTGASMLLIRPMLEANRDRANRVHLVVFFIFIVSNCGGLLTPFADPPLFLGFLKGVPFAWTLRFWREWLAINAMLLAAFLAVDFRLREPRPHQRLHAAGPPAIEGAHNFVFLAAIVAVILAKGSGLGSADGNWSFGVQESLMAAIAGASWITTDASVRERNGFTFAPIAEVAILFAGIFIAMIAPLAILNAKGGQLGIVTAGDYFWSTGLLSGFLDNAPTYLAFAAVACGQVGVGVESPRYLADYLAVRPDGSVVLEAISCGAVMMGAMTYIGNGPNLMVKAIAEENGVRMPGFVGYLAWSTAVLVPALVVVTLLFFR
jgi:Na+/H+ antiporter NhaD/arsenite permease-like protein